MNKIAMAIAACVLISTTAYADSPDSSFYKSAAEGGVSEVELGQIAKDKGSSAAVKAFGGMMVADHSAANEKLKALAVTKNVKLPDGSSLMQKASKAKLELLSGDTFDKSYVKSMIADHKDDIQEFQKEIDEGKDPEAKAYAQKTLPTLKMHLRKIEAIAAAAGIKED